MSSVVISGDTSGSVTLLAPTVAGNTTLTLPAVSGTVVLNNSADQTINGLTVGKGGNNQSANTAFGVASLASITSGNTCSAYGFYSLISNTTGGSNSALGYAAMQTNTTGNANTAIGQQTLFSNTTASDNTALGYQAAYSNTTGAGITAIGKGAAFAVTGNYNTIVGWRAGEAVTSGTDNTIVGALAGLLSTGSQNTFIGGPISGVSNGTGTAMTTGSKNTIIGRFTGNQGGLDIRTLDNYIVLSDGDGNPQAHFQPSGNLVIKRTTFSSINAIGCYQDTSASAANVFITTGGSFVRSTSSRKYKTDIQDATHGLADVLNLRSVTYKGTGNHDNEQVLGGLIAEEVHDAGLIEFVQYAEDGTPDALAYGHMVSLCVKAIQELNAKVIELEAKLESK